MRELLAYGFLITAMTWLAFNWFIICLHGGIIIREPVIWIRISELVFILAILSFAVERYVNWIRERRCHK